MTGLTHPERSAIGDFVEQDSIPFLRKRFLAPDARCATLTSVHAELDDATGPLADDLREFEPEVMNCVCGPAARCSPPSRTTPHCFECEFCWALIEKSRKDVGLTR